MQFILRHEVRHELNFAPINGSSWSEITGRTNSTIPPESIFVADKGKMYEYSGAVIIILKNMGGVWRFLGHFTSLFPRFFLDFFYKIIAGNRYAWFGTTDACMMPTPALRARFLD
ncbi:MAG: DUF393 domain-containing protein [Ignavibacteria bacterium]|nr:DUF393 domain-containing protein [Ignavibacteria bacterium]